MSWKDLNEFICLAHTSSDDVLAFTARFPSNAEARQALVAKLVDSVTDAIEVEAEKRLASIPKPDASAAEWKQVGVADDALFSDELLAGCKGLRQSNNPYTSANNLSFDDYNRRESWESLSVGSSHKAMVLVLHALAETSDPFEHLPSLVYLAHHARVPLHPILDVNMCQYGSGIIPSYRDLRLPYGSSLEQYILLTITQYFFFHIIEALDQGQACLANGLARKMSHPINTVCIVDYLVLDEHPNGEPVSSWTTEPSNDWFQNQRDSIHSGFWKAQEDSDRKEVNAEMREAYKQRCFDMLVTWYTLMKAYSLKNDAIDSGIPAFARKELSSLLRGALASFQYPFALYSDDTAPNSPQVEAVQGEFEELTHLEAQMVHEESSPLMRPSQIASQFLCLPSEIHFHIHLFLSPSSLLSLSTVCWLMRQQCLRTLYQDPFDLVNQGFGESPPIFQETDSTFFARVIKLHKLLLARPELRQYVRSLTVRASPLPHPEYGLRWDHGLPLLSTLAKNIPNVTTLTLALAYPGETLHMHQAGEFGSKAENASRRVSNILHYISQQYSQLSSLILSFQSWDTDMLSVIDTDHWHESPRIQDSDVFPSWSLQYVSISPPTRWRDPSDTPGVDAPPPIPIAPILRSSAESLRTLYLRAYRDDMGPVSAFPVLPSVIDLSLYVDMPPPKVQELLHRCFPALEDLLLSADGCIVGNDYTIFNSVPLDFALSSPELTTIEICKYRIERLPTKTARVSMVYLDLTEREVIGVASEDVLAVNVTVGFHLSHLKASVIMDAIRRTSLTFPALRTLDLAHGYSHIAYDVVAVANLLTFVSELRDILPLLEALLLTIQYFIIRPKRRDFPVDDGIDEIEHDYAIKIFKIYPSLRILSLTGTSSFRDFSSEKQRVWVRETCENEEVGARLVESPGAVHFPGYGYYIT